MPVDAGAGRAAAVRAPFAIAVRIDVEAAARIEAEAGIVGAAVAGVGGADVADHAGAADLRPDRGQIEREEQPVGAARGAVRAGVQRLVAIGAERLDRADRGHDLVAHELQGGDDMMPFVARSDLERLGGALPPGRGGADQLPERHDPIHALGAEPVAEGGELGAMGRRALQPGAEIGRGLARREAGSVVVLVARLEAEIARPQPAPAPAPRAGQDPRPAASAKAIGALPAGRAAGMTKSVAAIAAERINCRISTR